MQTGLPNPRRRPADASTPSSYAGMPP